MHAGHSPRTPGMSRRPAARAPTFLTLPREIRDSIYIHAIVSSSPLIAWAGMRLPEILELLPDGMTVSGYLTDSLGVERLAPKLLRCHSVISKEAALIFYSRNTFLFFRGFVWHTILEWLERIGPQNRRYLTRLDLLIQRPQKVWQLRDGSRTQLAETDCVTHSPWYNIQENIREQVYPPHRFLSFPSDVELEEGVVDNISPAVEMVFKLFGTDDVDAGLKLTMNLVLPVMMDGFVPGLNLGEDDDHWCSMDLPNVMEKCRQIHTNGKGKSVDILWKCKLPAETFKAEQEVMKNNGWEIVDKAFEVQWGDLDMRYVDADDHGIVYLAGYQPPQDALLTLKRTPIEGDVVSDGPSMWSWVYA